MKKVALITGAGSGIGKYTAITLLQNNFQVILCGRNLPKLESTLAEAGSAADQGICLIVDVSKPSSVQSLFSTVESKFGRLDVLFNNAGTNIPGLPFEDISWDQWHQVISTNLSGSFLCAQAAYQLMKRQEPQGGRIINNGSISAHTPRPNSAAYTASKHAITGLTKSIALDGRKYNIICSQIDIGNALTPMAARMPSGVPQADGSIAIEPTMDVQHVANTVLHMAQLPLSVNVPFVTIMASGMPYMGRG
ncbi:MAG: SDR family oxidoreductase [Saprospiraceae bacterium]|nr:SDR family oxidoreductase [Saprospiraceae bacterium]